MVRLPYTSIELPSVHGVQSKAMKIGVSMTKIKKLTQVEQKAKASLEAKKKSEQDALLINSASFMSAAVTENFGKSVLPDLDMQQLYEEIHTSVKSVQNGEMNGLEAMLVGQAKSLQTMFVSMARRASRQEYLKQYSTYMNLALKAQAQSRATIQALVELKYPRQVIVTQQANIANGHQQVNNGVVRSGLSEQYASTHTHGGKNQSDTNKLLESNNEQKQTIENQPQRLDTRAAQATITSDSTLETVDAVNGRKNA